LLHHAFAADSDGHDVRAVAAAISLLMGQGMSDTMPLVVSQLMTFS
jgi:hypothetical protein